MALSTMGPIDRVRDDVWTFSLEMPGYSTSSNCYLLLDAVGQLHVVDPGVENDENWARLVTAIESVGANVRDVRSIVATHLHPDHLGLGVRLRTAAGPNTELIVHHHEQSGIDLLAVLQRSPQQWSEQLAAWGVPEGRTAELVVIESVAPELTAERTVRDGERLDIPGFGLVVEWTPGHTHGSMCLRDDTRQLLITGDHVLPNAQPGVGVGGPSPTNPLSDYFTSLERVSAFPDHEVLPGHGNRFHGIVDRAAAHASHHRRRNREVDQVLQITPTASIWEVAEQLTWRAGWANLNGHHLRAALLQTEMHRDLLVGG